MSPRREQRAAGALGGGGAGGDDELREPDVAGAVRDVEEDLEELGDPDAGPTTPAATLAAQGSVSGRLVAAAAGGERDGAARELFRLSWPVIT
ncbi:MAG: hypothetical protein KC560_05630, partial [Myxococcales bacterium]|nr:hypothetical protein [Myxococcales bacterium]